MVSIASFKSSSLEHDVHFVNHGHIWSQIDDKAISNFAGSSFLNVHISILYEMSLGFWTVDWTKEAF